MNPGVVFVVEPGDLEQKAILLADSLRFFGGLDPAIPIFAINPGRKGSICAATKKKLNKSNVELVQEKLNLSYKFYPLANKIFASAYCEQKFDHEFDTLVFLDTDLLVLNCVSDLFNINPNHQVKVKPEERINTGQKPNEPLNVFWKMIYEHCGIHDLEKVWSVKSAVGSTQMRALYNPSLIVKKSGNGFYQQWLRNFEKVMTNIRLFEINYLQFYFIELSVFSATAVKMFKKEELDELSHVHNYPIHLHNTIENPAKRLDELTILHYHNHLRNRRELELFEIPDKYYDWLRDYLPQQICNKPLFQRLNEIIAFQKHKLKYKYNLI
ncbi:MAG: hypothetical protein O2887_05380 [Bacteroidetes bacterium]|nr:hypothetical protein [Bacteroidota bacterium]MDA1119913.1 hypothetical protein [Bacteroidota bacterium]